MSLIRKVSVSRRPTWPECFIMNLCSAAVDHHHHPLGFCFLRWPLYEQDPKAERKLKKEFEFSS